MNDDKYITEAHLFKANNKSHTHTRTKSYKTPFQMHHMVKVTRCYSLPPFCSLIFLCFQWPDKARSYQPTSKLTSEIALPITFLHHCVFWKTNCIFFIIIMHCARPIWFESVKLNMECDCHRDCFNFFCWTHESKPMQCQRLSCHAPLPNPQTQITFYNMQVIIPLLQNHTARFLG